MNGTAVLEKAAAQIAKMLERKVKALKVCSLRGLNNSSINSHLGWPSSFSVGKEISCCPNQSYHKN